jgi:hypothetical protein
MVDGNCEMMEEIGGYFELELCRKEHYHKNAILLNSARSCFEYILLARGYKKVYMPYYTCEVMLQPLLKHRIAYEFYSINESFELVKIVNLLPGEAFLYTNYFGLKQRYVEVLSTFYGTQLIVDNAQAFFAPRIDSIDTFYSPRKFFGVPDGGYLYTDYILDSNILIDSSYERMQHLILRIEKGAEAGYAAFKKADCSLDNQPILKMSKLTEQLLQSIDYEYVRNRRRANFQLLHERLRQTNSLSIFDLDSFSCPMVYPYYTERISLRSRLIKEKIFVATYWPNVLEWCKGGCQLERYFVDHIVPLPIDQRYINVDIEKIINLIE